VTVGTVTVTAVIGVDTVTGGAVTAGAVGIAGGCVTESTTPLAVAVGELETGEPAAASRAGSAPGTPPVSEGLSFVGALPSFPPVETPGRG
jgi:hypothetical protein